MGRSQETFSKKEKEKKKQQKKKDKEHKQELRNANSNKGKGLDDMLAYVDENGNLSATPPDPKKQKVINADDIPVSVIKKEDIVEEVLRKGKVSYFNESKGYGFIKDLKTQESIFVHVNALSQPLSENDKVTFETEQTKKGLTAVRVTKVS